MANSQAGERNRQGFQTDRINWKGNIDLRVKREMQEKQERGCQLPATQPATE